MTLKIGTCSWKYNSWKGILYPNQNDFNYLKEYSKHYNSVEIDQWFWSLFGIDKVKLPDAKHVLEYKNAVPNDFKFSIKIPNSITLTHFYSHGNSKDTPLTKNPYFLSSELFNKFLECIEPLEKFIGVLMFQFEYLNKKKMPSQNDFSHVLSDFFQKCPRQYQYALEIRNPNYINNMYFDFLNQHKLSHVLVQGYYMPHILNIYNKFNSYLNNLVVIRLMGPDRTDIEKKSANNWSAIIEPKDNEMIDIVTIIKELEKKGIEVYLNVNNHYEGSAPLTINKIKEMLNH